MRGGRGGGVLQIDGDLSETAVRPRPHYFCYGGRGSAGRSRPWSKEKIFVGRIGLEESPLNTAPLPCSLAQRKQEVKRRLEGE